MDITIIIVFAYLFLMFFLSLLIKNSKTIEEYSLAKHKLGILAVAAGLIMTQYGGGFILGGAELGYKYGWPGLVYGFSTAIGLLLLGLFTKTIYTKARKAKINTIPSFLAKTFKDRKIGLMSSILSVIALIGIASAQFFAAISVFSLIGISQKLSIILLFCIVTLISMKGISALTKFGKYNILIISFGAIIAIILASNATTGILNNNQTFESISIWGILALALPTILYTFIGQDIHQKIYSARSYKIAKIASFVSFAVLMLLAFFPTIVGMQTKSLFAIAAYEAMPKFISFAIPSFLKGLFIAAILAATIGSSQSVINAASTQIVEDVLRFKKILNNKHFYAIIFSILGSLIALGISLFSSSIINNLIVTYSIYVAGMFVPIVIAFFCKEPERFSKIIFLIAIVGIIVSLEIEFGILKTSMSSMFIGIIASLTLLLFYLALTTAFMKKVYKLGGLKQINQRDITSLKEGKI